MPPVICELIGRMGDIFNEMEKRRREDPDDFAEVLEMAQGDFGVAYAFFYMLVEQDLEEKGVIKTPVK